MKAVRRGDIFHRFFNGTTPPKNKFFVVVGEDDEYYVGYFFINSNINSYVQRHEHMFNMQMPLYVSDYPFLQHTSFVAAHSLAKIAKRALL